MNIYIQNKEMCYKNEPEIMEQMFKDINEYLNEKNLQFSHLIIDEEEIYDNFDSYIFENIKNIKKVQVVAMSVNEMANETMISTEQYAKNAIPIITKLSDEFYQKPSENAWIQLTNLFEGLQWIIQSLMQITSIEGLDDIINTCEWDEYVQEVYKLNNIIPEIENAIINKDDILVGDMLLYELIPIFETIMKKLEILISEAVN